MFSAKTISSTLAVTQHEGWSLVHWPKPDQAHLLPFLGVLGAFLGFAAVVFLILLFLRNRGSRALAARLEHARALTKALYAVVHRTWAFSLAVAALAFAAFCFGIWSRWIGTALTLVLIVQAGLWGAAFLDLMLDSYATRRRDMKSYAAALSLVRTLVSFVLWAVVLLSILNNLGINVTAMIAGLGIGGIAVGLAAQGIFADLFASLAIVFDKPFAQGDFITFGDNAGTIEHVGIKSTRIRSLTGEQIVLSNATLLQSSIRNFQRLRERRITFSVGVTYQTPYETVRQIPGVIRDIIEKADMARFNRAHFKEFGDSALVFETVYYVLDPDYNKYMDVQQAINLELMRRFAEMGVEFAYPTQTLFVSGMQAPDAAGAKA